MTAAQDDRDPPVFAGPKPEHFVNILGVREHPDNADLLLVVPQTEDLQQLPFSLSRNAARTLCEMLEPYLSEPQA